MGKYIDQAVVPGEKIIMEGEFALADNWLALTLSLGLLYLPIYHYQKTNEIAVTNNRIIGKSGIISRDTIDISLKSIESVDVSQTILGRIFGYGDVSITGSGGIKRNIVGIKEPEKLKQAINTAVYS